MYGMELPSLEQAASMEAEKSLSTWVMSPGLCYRLMGNQRFTGWETVFGVSMWKKQ